MIMLSFVPHLIPSIKQQTAYGVHLSSLASHCLSLSDELNTFATAVPANTLSFQLRTWMQSLEFDWGVKPATYLDGLVQDSSNSVANALDLLQSCAKSTIYLCVNGQKRCDQRRILLFTLRWRHNEHDSVSNHQPHDCLLNHLFGRRSK